jgi:molecular chaperone GrpE (heat shock protein)
VPVRKRAKSARQVAHEMGLPETTVDRYLNLGMPVHEPARTQWVNAHRAATEDRGGDDEMTRLKKAELAAKVLRHQRAAERAALDLERERGKLVQRAAVDAKLEAFCNDLRQRLQGLPARIEQLGRDDAQKIDLRAEAEQVVDDLLNMMADAHGR